MHAKDEVFHAMKHEEEREDDGGHFERIENVFGSGVEPGFRVQSLHLLLLRQGRSLQSKQHVVAEQKITKKEKQTMTDIGIAAGVQAKGAAHS